MIGSTFWQAEHQSALIIATVGFACAKVTAAEKVRMKATDIAIAVILFIFFLCLLTKKLAF